MPTIPLEFRNAPTFSPKRQPRPSRKISPANLFEKFIGVEALRDLYARARRRGGSQFFENVLDELRVKIRVSDADLQRIPASGPVIVCANHPFGILDGMVLGATLLRMRPDTRILTNLLLKDIAELEPYCFWIDPFSSGDAAQNLASIRKALGWLSQGGVLATFPAGEVSHWRFLERTVADAQWSETAVRLARRTKAVIVPLHFDGQNSAIFQGLGCVHPSLRTLRLPSELLNKTGNEVGLRIGSPVTLEELSRFEPHEAATSHLRARCEVLATPPARKSRFIVAKDEPPSVAVSQPRELISEELEQLPASRRLAENDEFVVLCAKAVEIPTAMLQVGRLREVAFRAVGEGSGQPFDLDEFDRYYTHLILWDKHKQEIAGGYRIGATKDILPRHGTAGLYTSTLFAFDESFFRRMGAGLELGRSFILPQYQRRYSPLLLLWKAIAHFAVLNADSPVLFGAVSISANYSRVSRELIARYFDDDKPEDLACLVRPRSPIRFGAVDPRKAEILTSALKDSAALARLVGDIEPDNKSIPILLTQYLKLGGRVLGFNVDRKFSDVLDGLIYVDLRQTSDRALQRYMSQEGLRTFRRYHVEDAAVYPQIPPVRPQFIPVQQN